MVNKKKPTLTDAHLEEFYIRLVEVLEHNPDFWELVGYRKREKLNDAVELSLLQDDPIEYLKNTLDIDSYSLFKQLLDSPVGKMQPFYVSLARKGTTGFPIFHLDLRFSDRVIIQGIMREIDYLKEHNFLISHILKPGVIPPNTIAVRIEVRLGKTKIRQLLTQILKKHPRDTERTSFSPEIWRRDYGIYKLYRNGLGYTFKEIGIKLDMDESAVKKAYQRIYRHIHQVDEYGTKETRGELCVDITRGLKTPLDKAEVQYARLQMIGGTKARSGVYEEPAVGWPTEEKEKVKFKVCGLNFRFQPGSEGCLYCNQTPEPIYYSRQQKRWRFNPGKAVKRTMPLKDKTPYPLKSEPEPPHYKKIDELISIPRLPREQELTLQAEYIKWFGTKPSCPWEAPQPEDEYHFDVIPHSSGQYSLAFTMRKDLLEWLIVNQIDQRAKKFH